MQDSAETAAALPLLLWRRDRPPPQKNIYMSNCKEERQGVEILAALRRVKPDEYRVPLCDFNLFIRKVLGRV